MNRPPLRRPGRDEEGTATIEFVVLAVLTMVPLVYLIVTLGQVQAGAYAVSAAARESGRVFVTAPDEATATARAGAAAELAFGNLGFTSGTSHRIECTASPCLTPGASVVTSTEVRVPLPLIPSAARGVIPLEITLTGHDVSPVDRFRAAR